MRSEGLLWSVGRLVNLLVCDFVSPHVFSRTVAAVVPNVDMWVCATGARHSKSLERRCPRTACLRRGPKITYSYYTRCALIKDHQPTAWDDFARTGEAETTCIRKVSHQIVVERFLKFSIISVK